MDGQTELTEAAKTISLRLCQGIIKLYDHIDLLLFMPKMLNWEKSLEVLPLKTKNKFQKF